MSAADRLLAWNEGQSTPGYGPDFVQFRVDLRAVLIQCRRMEVALDEMVGAHQDAEREIAAKVAAELAQILGSRGQHT